MNHKFVFNQINSGAVKLNFIAYLVCVSTLLPKNDKMILLDTVGYGKYFRIVKFLRDSELGCNKVYRGCYVHVRCQTISLKGILSNWALFCKHCNPTNICTYKFLCFAQVGYIQEYLFSRISDFCIGSWWVWTYSGALIFAHQSCPRI